MRLPQSIPYRWTKYFLLYGSPFGDPILVIAGEELSLTGHKFQIHCLFLLRVVLTSSSRTVLTSLNRLFEESEL